MSRAIVSLALIAGCGRVGFDTEDRRIDAPSIDAPVFAECTTRTALPVPASGRVTGTLAVGASTTEGTCSGDATDEVVYQLDVTQPGSRIQVSADEGPANGEVAMYIRTACDAPASELECDATDGVADSPLITRDAPPGRYFVFVDGQSGTNGGAFAAALSVLLPLGATCDPTNARERCGPSLGCDGTTCVRESCDAAEVLGGSSPFAVIANTDTQRNLHGGTCGDGGDGGSRAKEKMYRIDLAAAVSNMNVSTVNPNTDYDTLVYVRAGCTGIELACNDDVNAEHSSIVNTGPLVAGSYFIFIDGFGPQSGLATVTITLTP